ncbi:hypothetical protein [Algoriphagus aquimarinus]|uniref:hypothetical protein n=1 Tax=Algoriphagus aquimarinus TaxID=237018 RepID=UPI0030DCECCF|tara:strand:- start:1783 stop:2550 length:768 start_codon:yes stop_codon:yes gene_type:complete
MEFNEKFKTYSNTELLRIIDNPDGYQTKAVETAKTIFSDRQLTQEEIKIAKDELEIERQEKLNKEQKKRAVEDKFKNIGKSILENVNPIQNETPTTEKTIKIISLLFGGLFLFLLYREFGMISFMFTDSSGDWDFSIVLYFLPLVVVPTATILFYKRKKFGWLLLTMYLTYSAVSAIGLFILTMNMKPSGFDALDNFFPQTSSTTHLLTFLFFVGTIWAISRENIRTVYSITKQTMVLTISIAAIIVGLGLKTFF